MFLRPEFVYDVFARLKELVETVYNRSVIACDPLSQLVSYANCILETQTIHVPSQQRHHELLPNHTSYIITLRQFKVNTIKTVLGTATKNDIIIVLQTQQNQNERVSGVARQLATRGYNVLNLVRCDTKLSKHVTLFKGLSQANKQIQSIIGNENSFLCSAAQSTFLAYQSEHHTIIQALRTLQTLSQHNIHITNDQTYAAVSQLFVHDVGVNGLMEELFDSYIHSAQMFALNTFAHSLTFGVTQRTLNTFTQAIIENLCRIDLFTNRNITICVAQLFLRVAQLYPSYVLTETCLEAFHTLFIPTGMWNEMEIISYFMQIAIKFEFPCTLRLDLQTFQQKQSENEILSRRNINILTSAVVREIETVNDMEIPCVISSLVLRFVSGNAKPSPMYFLRSKDPLIALRFFILCQPSVPSTHWEEVFGEDWMYLFEDVLDVLHWWRDAELNTAMNALTDFTDLVNKYFDPNVEENASFFKWYDPQWQRMNRATEIWLKVVDI